MKIQILIALLLASGINTLGYANPNHILLSATEVAAGRNLRITSTEVISAITAGRNLRNSGLSQCELTIKTGGSRAEEAKVVISLPKTARYISAKVKSPARIMSNCAKSGVVANKNTVQCKLTRMIPNQKIILVTSYKQSAPTGGKCSGYIEAGSRR